MTGAAVAAADEVHAAVAAAVAGGGPSFILSSCFGGPAAPGTIAR